MDGGAADEQLRIEAVNVIHDEVDRLSNLINNLLSITKIEMGSMRLDRQRVKLLELLKDIMLSISRNGMEDNLHFSLDLPNEITPISVDKDLLRIAINNLLTNAIKYNEPGGSVTLSAEETEDFIRICVKDSGIGIDSSEHAAIFEKFYRSDKEAARLRSGHGLGLPLAKQITELHHGRLTVKSSPGDGTEFTIELAKEADLIKQAI